MANKFPLILDVTGTPQIAEIKSGDFIDMTNNGISNLAVGNLNIPGGTSGQVLTTNGAGVLSWGSASASGPVMGAYLNASQNITTNSWTTLRFDSVDYDTASGYNSTNGRYTPGVAGYYQINAAALAIGTNPQNWLLAIYKNGVIYCRGTQFALPAPTANYNVACQVTAIVRLVATDYIDIRSYVTSTSPVAAGGTDRTTRIEAAFIRGL